MNITVKMTELAACLSAQITKDGLPEPCWIGIVPGNQAVSNFMPDCFTGDAPDGMAWVRLSTSYPSFEPGLQIESPLDSFNAPLGYELELGIVRSMPIPEEGIDAPEAAAVVDLQMRDMLTMRRAVLCCATFERGDVLLGPYTPLGPEGGVVGGTFQLGIQSP